MLRQGLLEAVELADEANRMRDPCPIVRTIFWLSDTFYKPTDSGVTFTEEQNRIDEERQRKFQMAIEIVRSHKQYADPIMEWLSHHGINRNRLADAIRNLIMANFGARRAERIVNELEELQMLVDQTEITERSAERTERKIRESMDLLSLRTGFNIDLKIFQE